jgi:hypothetical protein
MKSDVYKSKVDTPYELLSRSLGAAASMKKREDQLRRNNAILAHDLQSAVRLTMGIFENLL